MTVEELSSMIYITDIRLCHFPSGESVNNSKMMKTDTRLKGPCLVVTSDDGQVSHHRISFHPTLNRVYRKNLPIHIDLSRSMVVLL